MAVSVMQVAMQQISLGTTMGVLSAAVAVLSLLATVYVLVKKKVYESDIRELGITTGILGLIGSVLSHLTTVPGIVGEVLAVSSMGVMGIIAGYIAILVVAMFYQAKEVS